jgi:chorismate-pyruvate lyase
VLNSTQLGYNLVEQILCLEGSTTFFLETLANKKLQVHVVSQSEHCINGNIVIKRAVKLYFDHPELPIFYCLSYIEKDVLTNAEYDGLMSERIPIGKIFSDEGQPDIINKKNVSVAKILDGSISSELQISGEEIYSKIFQFYVNNRYIGIIEEYFHEDTLQRF